MIATSASPVSGLAFEPDAPREHLGILLYGPEGIGKTVAAASAPGPILYCNADGPGALRYARRHHPGTEIREFKITSRASIEQAYLYLADGGDGAQTVVWDSLGRFYDVVLQDLAKDDKHPTLPERGDVNTFIERHVLALLELPVHLVLVAHDNPVKVAGNDEEGTASHELFPFTGTNNSTLAKKLMRPLDVVAYCGRIDPDVEGKPSRYVAQLFSGGGRRAKDRTGVLGEVADLDVSAWVAANAAVDGPAGGTTSNDEEE